MGIEPTRSSYEPHTGFEDQGHHQAPVTSKIAYVHLLGFALEMSQADQREAVTRAVLVCTMAHFQREDQ